MNLEGAGDDNLMVSLGKKIGWRGVLATGDSGRGLNPDCCHGSVWMRSGANFYCKHGRGWRCGGGSRQ